MNHWLQCMLKTKIKTHVQDVLTDPLLDAGLTL